MNENKQGFSTDKYIPGVCNIGPEEIKARSRAGMTGLTASIILYVLLLIIGANPLWRLLIFFL